MKLRLNVTKTLFWPTKYMNIGKDKTSTKYKWFTVILSLYLTCKLHHLCICFCWIGTESFFLSPNNIPYISLITTVHWDPLSAWLFWGKSQPFKISTEKKNGMKWYPWQLPSYHIPANSLSIDWYSWNLVAAKNSHYTA